MSDVTPAPVKRSVPHNTTIAALRVMWAATFVVGLTAILVAFLSRDKQLEELRVAVADLGSTFDSGSTGSAAAAFFTAALAAVGIVILVELVLLRAMLDGHGWSRWVLLPVVILHIGVAIAAAAVLALGNGGITIATLLGAQLVLACAATLVGFLPKSSEWLRRQRASKAGIIA